MTRRYTPEQIEQRRAYTRAWKLRNPHKVAEREQRPEVKARRRKLARARRRKNPDHHRRLAKLSRLRNRVTRAAKQRAYRLANLAARREAFRRFCEENPNYFRERIARKRLRSAWMHWSRVCAASRARLTAVEA